MIGEDCEEEEEEDGGSFLAISTTNLSPIDDDLEEEGEEDEEEDEEEEIPDYPIDETFQNDSATSMVDELGPSRVDDLQDLDLEPEKNEPEVMEEIVEVEVEKKNVVEAFAESLKGRNAFHHVEVALFKQGAKKNFIYRLILFGSHNKTEIEISRWNSNTIDSINQRCFDDPLTGFLVIYPKHFIHLLEGSESSLNGYVMASAYDYNDFPSKAKTAESKADSSVKHDETSKKSEPDLDDSGNKRPVQSEQANRKIILGYFNVKERFAKRWNFQVFTPPQRQYDKDGFRKRLFRFVQNISVISVIAGKQQDRRPEETKKSNVNDKSIGESDKLLGKKADEFLPSIEFINYLLAKKKRTIPLRTPLEFIEKYLPIKNVVLSNDDDWPIPCRFAPYD